MKSLYLMAIALLLLSSCMRSDDHISLNYQPILKSEELVEGSENTSVQLVILDNRSNKMTVSTRLSMQGNDNGAIISDTNIGELVRNALTSELTLRGFKISSKAPTAIVNVEINKFYSNFKLGIWAHSNVAEASFNINVQKPGGMVLYSRNIRGFGDNKEILLMNGKNAKPALEEALKTAMEKLMNDKKFINALVK